jgi:hypothetical protein
LAGNLLFVPGGGDIKVAVAAAVCSHILLPVGARTHDVFIPIIREPLGK